MEKSKAILAFGNDVAMMMKEGRPYTAPVRSYHAGNASTRKITRTSILMMFRIIGYSFPKPRFGGAFPVPNLSARQE